MYQCKRQEVKAVKQELQDWRSKKRNDEDTEHHYKKQRSAAIREQIAVSSHHIKEFNDRKKHQLKDEYKEKTEGEKRLIYKYESEAQELERLEEQLIKELQETQDEEREAYRELEEAMLAASVSKKERVGMSAPGVSLDGRSDQLPSLIGAAQGKGSRFLTSSVHVSHGFG